MGRVISSGRAATVLIERRQGGESAVRREGNAGRVRRAGAHMSSREVTMRVNHRTELVDQQTLESVIGRPSYPAARRDFGIAAISAGGQTYRVMQRDLLRLPFALLTEFSHAGASRRRVLVVAPLGGGFALLLRDLVVGLLRHARVAVTDWLDARYVPSDQGAFRFEDNVAYVAAMMRRLGPNLHVIAVCQGAVPALAATALVAAQEPAAAPASVTLMGGPVDPLANPTRVVKSLRAHPLDWFDHTVIATVPRGYPGAGRRVYPASRQLATLTGYIARHAATGGELFWKLNFDDGEDPIRFPLWRLCYSLMDLPAEFFLSNVHHVFQEPALCTGKLRVRGRRVDLAAIRRTAVMTIEGEDDDLAAPGQTRAAHALCASVPDGARRQLVMPNCGHFSLFYGRTWRSRILPEIVEFMRASAALAAGPNLHPARDWGG
jgi:poly(3-hydroxybutyrate) depolymerase